MKKSFYFEILESRHLLAGDDEFSSNAADASCVFDQEYLSEVDHGDEESHAASLDTLVSALAHALARISVTGVSIGLGLVEGAVVAAPSWVLIKGIEASRGELSVPGKILIGLATYSGSLQFFAELISEKNPTDPILKCLYPVKAWVDYSNTWIDSFEENSFLDAASWAKALQPRALKNAYWSASTTVFSGLPSGFDYPHLELPEHPEGVEGCHCTCP